MHLTLRHKVNGAIIITFAFIALLFTLIQLPYRAHHLERSIENIEVLLQTLIERDTEQLANEIFDGRIKAIEIRIESMFTVEGILGISVLDRNGQVLATSGSSFINSELPPSQQQSILKHPQLEEIKWQGHAGIIYSKHLNFLGEQLGFIRIHYSLQQVEKDQAIMLYIFGSLLLTILLAMLVLLNYILSKSILHPIRYLRDATHFIVEGDLDKDIVMQRRDELGNLAESFNRMRDAIRKQITRLSVEVEERKRAEYNLKITLDSIGDGVISTDINGSVTQMNPVAERLTGWKLHEAHGRNLQEVFRVVDKDTGKDAENPIDTFTGKDHLEKMTRKAVLISREGAECLIFHSGAPIRSESGETLGVVLVFRDISEEHALQERLQQSQKMDAIGQLAGGVAHDFNNMLGGITGATEMLALYLPDEPQARKLHSIILEAAGRSAELIENLLAFARNSPKLSTTVDLHEIISGTGVLLKNSLDRRIKLEIRLDAERYTASGDPAQLQTALLNLGINASHAMAEGGVLEITTRNQVIDTPYCEASPFSLQPGEFIQIEVKDDGCGIPAKNLNKIFEPFFTTKELGRGTGLGLSAVYGTIQRHHGAVNVYSEEGIGTVFHLLLPLVSRSPDVMEQAEQSLQKGSGCILVVDDEEVVRSTAKVMLEELGYEVILAGNGKEGLDIYSKKSDQIDLVILDMIMPVMNGNDCFAGLQERNPQVKVVLSSGFVPDESLESMRAKGLKGFIRKPYLTKALSQAVYDALQ